MTIISDVDPKLRELVIKQINRLVNVLQATDLTDGPAVARELVLLRVRATMEHRTAILKIVGSPESLWAQSTPGVRRLAAIPLASGSSGIAFFGDLDQTIYEWRGSKPDEVIKRVKADFGPVTELPLLHNYRATKSLLRVADRHASTLADRRTRIRNDWQTQTHGLAMGLLARLFDIGAGHSRVMQEGYAGIERHIADKRTASSAR